MKLLKIAVVASALALVAVSSASTAGPLTKAAKSELVAPAGLPVTKAAWYTDVYGVTWGNVCRNGGYYCYTPYYYTFNTPCHCVNNAGQIWLYGRITGQ